MCCSTEGVKYDLKRTGTSREDMKEDWIVQCRGIKAYYYYSAPPCRYASARLLHPAPGMKSEGSNTTGMEVVNHTAIIFSEWKAQSVRVQPVKWE